MLKCVGAAVVSLGLWAATAQAAVTLDGAGRCLDTADRALCLLTLVGTVDDGASLGADPELAARPQLLKAAGVAEAPSAAPSPKTSGPLPDDFLRLQKAVKAVLALDRAGRPPEEALAPLDELPGAEAKRDLINTMLLGEQFGPPSAGLRAVILAGWERSLRARTEAQEDRLATVSHIIHLALAYVAEKDEAAMMRALELLDREAPTIRIAFLAEVGHLDRAEELIGREEAKLAPPLPADDLAAQAEREEKRSMLRDARATLVVAAMEAGRPDLARPHADLLLGDPDEILQNPALPVIAAAATPAVAQALLDRLEPETRADYAPLNAALPAQNLAAAWLKMGRRDRFDGVVKWLKPLAKDDRDVAEALAELLLAAGRPDEAAPFIDRQELDDLLELDIEAGRGLVNLDLYLKIAVYPRAKVDLLAHCASEAAGENDFKSVRDCLARIVALKAHPQPDAAYLALTIAAAIAHDEPEAAREIATAGLTLARGAPETMPSPMDEIFAAQLVQIAKIDLRADGRLPPLATPSER